MNIYQNIKMTRPIEIWYTKWKAFDNKEIKLILKGCSKQKMLKKLLV